MATWKYSGAALVIELDHQETQDFLQKIKNPNDVLPWLTAIGIANFAAGVVVAALSAHSAWESAAIAAADKGDGVILTQPLFPVGGLILIPSTRHSTDGNAGWSSRLDSELKSPEGDEITVHVERGAIPPDAVRFWVHNRTTKCWNKALAVFSGGGGRTWIEAQGCGDAQDGLYTNELAYGRVEFWKPKELGIWREIFAIQELDKLQGGDVVHFTWTVDEV
jgi:hypothetical protein